MKKLSRVAFATCIMGAGFTASAQASEYYNCANATGCRLVATQEAKTDYTATKYPVVMAHGMGGWTKAFGVLEYWFGIPESLMAGGTEVYTTKTSSFNDSEVRGEQLLRQVQTITAMTGKEKVNLFGHSHGGIDIRYVAAVAPEKVQSVTAVASPEQGSKMADWVVKTVTEGSAKDGYKNGELNPSSKFFISLFNVAGQVMDVGSGLTLEQLHEQDSWRGLISLSTDYAQNYFNVKYPDAMPDVYCGKPPSQNTVNGVSYYSFSGVGAIHNIFDPSDYLMYLTGLSFGDDLNDGLVSACSSRLGYVIRDDYRMNHLDSVNQLLGLTSWREADPVAVYRSQVNRLKREGY